ncbi:MAG TPA: hypothetical protein VFA26_24645 [Gemmataceae bacterium]|nr:hypothetical protein [Gemmataceae bacterium]
MRRAGGLLLALLAGLGAGCVHDQPARPDRWRSQLPFRGPTGEDVVHLYVATLQRPAGDRTLNGGLWDVANEQAVGLERVGVLEDNGFRVGRLSGALPPEMLALFNDRNCLNPRLRQLRAGNPVSLPLGPPLAQCGFRVRADGQESDVQFDGAECNLVVTPTLAPDGRVCLRFMPEVVHGPARLTFQAAADNSGFLLREQRATETYPALGWEVTLAPAETLVIGARPDRAGTLGCRCFVRDDERPATQRVLVIRAGRTAPTVSSEMAADPAAEPGEEPPRRAPPLAVQAAGSGAVRGTAP